MSEKRKKGDRFAIITLANLVFAGLYGFKQWVREIAMAGGVRLIRLLVLGTVAGLGFYGCFYKFWPTTISSRAVTTFEETKPISKLKTWRVVDRVNASVTPERASAEG